MRLRKKKTNPPEPFDYIKHSVYRPMLEGLTEDDSLMVTARDIAKAVDLVLGLGDIT